MFRASPVAFAQGQYKARLKTRMVGYVPKVVPRKIKGALVMMRSEANTGVYEGYIKNPIERMENTGKKHQAVMFDEAIGRHVVAKEAKIKAPTMTKTCIQKKVQVPW